MGTFRTCVSRIVQCLCIRRNNREGSGSDCPCLIEDKGVRFGERFEIVAAFYQNTMPGSRTDSAEESKRDGDYQCTRAGDDEEDERTENPFLPDTVEEQRRDERCGKCGNHNSRCIIPCEDADEVLRLCFFRGGIFHEL